MHSTTPLPFLEPVENVMAPSAAKKSRSEGEEEHPAVTLFREYLRIKSVQPDPDYDSCVSFLTRMANELELPYRVVEMVKGKPIFLMTWEGTEPELPSLLLNSHTDVVPVYPGEYFLLAYRTRLPFYLKIILRQSAGNMIPSKPSRKKTETSTAAARKT